MNRCDQNLMTRYALAFALLLPIAAEANFAKCLLDQLPGAQNDVAANAIWQTCMGKHPGGMASVGQGSGRGWFSFKSGAECTAKKAADTRSNRAASMINAACRKLYDTPAAAFDPSTARRAD